MYEYTTSIVARWYAVWQLGRLLFMNQKTKALLFTDRCMFLDVLYRLFVKLFILLLFVLCPTLLKPLKSTVSWQSWSNPSTSPVLWPLFRNQCIFLRSIQLFPFIFPCIMSCCMRFLRPLNVLFMSFYQLPFLLKLLIESMRINVSSVREVLRGWHVGESAVTNWIMGYDRGSWNLGAYRNGENKMSWERKQRKIAISKIKHNTLHYRIPKHKLDDARK